MNYVESLIHIEDSSGIEVLTFTPSTAFQSIAFSPSELVSGETYTVFYGDSAAGTAVSGLYQDGGTEDGTEYTSFTVSSTITTIDSMGRR